MTDIDKVNEFDAVQKLLNENQLEQAKTLCDAWVANNPSDVAFNATGLVYATLGLMNEATQFFQKALVQNPNVVAYHNNISNAYLALGYIDKAKQHLFQALRIDPQHAESYNNLGSLLYKQQLFLEAIPYFQKALRIDPKYWEAHYNLAHSYSKTNQVQLAITHYKEVLTQKPQHPIAHFNLGLLFFEVKAFIMAEQHLQTAVALNPSNSIAAEYLGNTLIELGKIDEAILSYQKSLEIIFQEENTDSTKSLNEQTHNKEKTSEIHHNLAILFLRTQDKKNALFHFEKSVSLNSNNETAKHMIQALKGEESTEAPPKYIKALFDQYADYYNEHVKTQLKYEVPGLLRNAVGKTLKNKLHTGRVLDLGCGTGLCGIYFRDLALELIGVDISAKMLEKAIELGAYDEVKNCDLIDYLSLPNLMSFDLIIAADVLVYRGDLKILFEKVSRALNIEGLFAFTTEHLDDEFADVFVGVLENAKMPLEQPRYHLQETGRFSHSKQYIHELAQEFQFSIELEEPIIPRLHQDKDLKGDLYILKKM